MHSRPIHPPSDEQASPIVNLCNKFLHDSLVRGVTALEFVGAGSLPAVNQQLQGNWQPYMQYPAPVFAAVALHLRRLAHFADDQAEAAGVIHVSHEGRDVEIGLTAKRSGDGTDILTLRFPANPPATGAAT